MLSVLRRWQLPSLRLVSARWLLPALQQWPAAFAAVSGVMLAICAHDSGTDGHVGDPAGHDVGHGRVTSASRLPPVPDLPRPRPAAAGSAEAAATPAVDPASNNTSAQLERLRMLLARRLSHDLRGTLAALLTLGDRQRDYLAEDLVRQAAERAPEQTVQWLDEHFTGGEREALLMAAYAGMARHDPMFAMGSVQTLVDPGTRRLATHQVLETWAEVDVVTAYEWVRTRSPATSDDLYVTVMQAYMEKFPQQAGQLIADLPSSPTRRRLVDRYAYDLAETNAAAAAAWVSQHDDQFSSQSALSSVFDQWVHQDPWAAIDYAALNVDGELGFELVGQIAAEMGTSRPVELAKSLERLPEAYRTLAAHRLANAWAVRNPEQARRWVASLPDGEVREQARRGLTETSGRAETLSLL